MWHWRGSASPSFPGIPSAPARPGTPLIKRNAQWTSSETSCREYLESLKCCFKLWLRLVNIQQFVFPEWEREQTTCTTNFMWFNQLNSFWQWKLIGNEWTLPSKPGSPGTPSTRRGEEEAELKLWLDMRRGECVYLVRPSRDYQEILNENRKPFSESAHVTANTDLTNLLLPWGHGLQAFLHVHPFL